jgi:hypothetical protein
MEKERRYRMKIIKNSWHYKLFYSMHADGDGRYWGPREISFPSYLLNVLLSIVLISPLLGLSWLAEKFIMKLTAMIEFIVPNVILPPVDFLFLVVEKLYEKVCAPINFVE